MVREQILIIIIIIVKGTEQDSSKGLNLQPNHLINNRLNILYVWDIKKYENRWKLTTEKGHSRQPSHFYCNPTRNLFKNTDPKCTMASDQYCTLFPYLMKETFAAHHLYFSASTAAKAERYLSMAACASGVKSSPMWQPSATSKQCVRSCREDQVWLESQAGQFRLNPITWWKGEYSVLMRNRFRTNHDSYFCEIWIWILKLKEMLEAP